VITMPLLLQYCIIQINKSNSIFNKLYTANLKVLDEENVFELHDCFRQEQAENSHWSIDDLPSSNSTRSGSGVLANFDSKLL